MWSVSVSFTHIAKSGVLPSAVTYRSILMIEKEWISEMLVYNVT